MDAVALLGRAALSAIFIWAGIGKALAPAGFIGLLTTVGVPVPEVAYGVTVAIELVGGLFLLIGFKPRVSALVLGVWCIVTALIAHSDFSNHDQQINFMKNVAMFGGMLQVVAFGAGRFAVTRR